MAKTRTIDHHDHEDVETLLTNNHGAEVWAVTSCNAKLTNAKFLPPVRATSADVFRVYREIWGEDGLVREVKLTFVRQPERMRECITDIPKAQKKLQTA